MRSLPFVLAFAALATSAEAALAPEYYEEARRTADSVVVISVERVNGLRFGRGYGDCRVRGAVAAVERGSRYSAGQSIDLRIPCARSNASLPASPVQWEDQAQLRRSQYGRAWLTPEGELALYQYEILAALP